ncbi:MAG TPA: NAD-dependent epimerase/dehydratase family protein [Chthonomonadaceae bacterium]|nr:NAD-dependent epimerase/dehydratase family protein [Chthonomonadaceae bacterium]
MRLLILGGTIFLGRALAECALERGHAATLFHRGKHNPELFPEVERILGDRNADLDRLDGRTWDAVIDTCGYFPRQVAASAQRLAKACGHYTFVSSVSVYASFAEPGMDESGAVGTIEDAATEEITGETYGPLKALCEQAAEAAMPGRVFNVRPGLIVGPHDPSDRFTYWPVRIARGGDVLAPDRPGVLVQIIDARDLAQWMVHVAEDGLTGVYNATGPAGPLTMGEVLDSCIRIAESDARLRWAPPSFLAEQEVAAWSEMPLWVPDSEGAGFSAIDCSKAIRDGLTFRPVDTIVRDTLDWARAWPPDRTLRAGIAPDKEAAVLAALAGTTALS